MIPADLLDQLRETDEELFLKVIGGSPLKNGKYLSILDMEPPAALAWFQHCIQAAIQARGWCGWAGRTGTSCFAEIHIKGAKSRLENHEILLGHADTEAEALLRAYLAAIQEAT